MIKYRIFLGILLSISSGIAGIAFGVYVFGVLINIDVHDGSDVVIFIAMCLLFIIIILATVALIIIGFWITGAEPSDNFTHFTFVSGGPGILVPIPHYKNEEDDKEEKESEILNANNDDSSIEPIEEKPKKKISLTIVVIVLSILLVIAVTVIIWLLYYKSQPNYTTVVFQTPEGESETYTQYWKNQMLYWVQNTQG